MLWEWFATAKATSQVSLCTFAWFLKSYILVWTACDKFWGLYCHLQLDAFIAPILGQFPSNHFQTVFFSLFLFSCWYVTYVFCVCPSGNEVIGVDSAEVRASVQYLHIIDNQQTLFELSHKLEPRAWKHRSTCHRGLNATCHTFARSLYQQRCPVDCKVPNVLHFWDI